MVPIVIPRDLIRNKPIIFKLIKQLTPERGLEKLTQSDEEAHTLTNSLGAVTIYNCG